MTPDEIEAHDKRQSAVHEAGHAVVAFANGVFVRAWLERTDTKDARFEKIWVGHVQYVHGSVAANMVIGIAGIVAESVEDEPEITAEEIVEYWRDDIIIPSPSDLEFMPASWRERREAVELALGTIVTQRALFESVVSELVDHGVVTDDRMIKLASSHFLAPAVVKPMVKKKKPKKADRGK